MMSATYKILILASLLVWCSADKSKSWSKVRLVGGTGNHEGTVEILSYKEEQYGAICDDFWDIEDADVVCRMMDFPGAEIAWKYSHFGASSSPILLDDVACNGEEQDITNCEATENWRHDCTQLEHAGVTCKRVVSINNVIRIYVDDTWMTVCGDEGSWTLAESTVYCRSVDQMIPTYLNLVDSSDILERYYPQASASVSCSGDEEDLLQCSVRAYSQEEENSESEGRPVYCPKVQCISAELRSGRSSNEGLLAIRFHKEEPSYFIRTVSQEGAQTLCMKMGFADVADIVTDPHFKMDIVNGEMAFDLSCEGEERAWWEGCENNIKWNEGSGTEAMRHPIGLVCKPYYGIASVTSFDHWSMEIAKDPIPTQTPTLQSSRPGMLATTTTTASPFHASSNGTRWGRSPTAIRGCSLEGSYDYMTSDDFTLDDCSVIRDERGPVGSGILSSLTPSASLVFPGLSTSSAHRIVGGRVFCADDQCPDGFALAYWFTLPACTKPSVISKIRNGDQSCIVLEARSRIRIKADSDNEDGQITVSTPACSVSGDVKSSTCCSEAMYSRSFTSTPFYTEMDAGEGCGHLIWNHVALNVHRSDSDMMCELFINGESEEFSCEPLRQCLSTVELGIGLVSELGPDTGLDEVGLWRRPLSSTEVISLYHQPTDLPETFTDIPLWVEPLQGKAPNCPCKMPTEMDIVQHVDEEEDFAPTDLLQISELLTTVTNMSDFTAYENMKEKHEAIQSSLDVISSVTKLSAKKAKESKDSKATFDEIGHNILGSLEALQNALLDDVTIFNKFTSDEIEITTAPTQMGSDFIYNSADNDATSVRISSKNFKQGARVSVALLKGTAAAFLPRKLTQKDRPPMESDVASPVLNLQTAGVATTSLEENITFTIPHNQGTIKPKNASFVCSFYEPDLKSFSNDGCTRVSRRSDDQSTTCSCNHMTSFAILMAVVDVTVSRGNEFALDVITYTGCGLSIIALIFSLIVIGVSRLKSIRIQILTNQCVAMLLAQSLFISAVENASVNMVACKIVAALLHLFFLAVIFWMLVQGVYMYSRTTMLHKANIPLKYFLLVGWGVPVVIVGATAAVNVDLYGMEDICWLNRDNGGIWIFVVPALIMALLNTVVMVLTVKALRSVKVFQNKTDKEKIKSTVKATVVLLPILGVTWITGILVNISIIFSYLFAISNAFQGLFLFILQILINAEIRSALRLRKSRILPFNTSSIGESSAMSKNPERSKNGTKSTKNTTQTGVHVSSISGNGPSVVADDSMPAPQ